MARKKLSDWERGFYQGFAMAISALALPPYNQPKAAWRLCRHHGFSVEGLMAVAGESSQLGLREVHNEQMAEPRLESEALR